MDHPEPISPELSQLLSAARSQMPQAPAELQARVLERVRASVAGGGGGAGSASGAGGIIGIGGALLVLVGTSYMALSSQGPDATVATEADIVAEVRARPVVAIASPVAPTKTPAAEDVAPRPALASTTSNRAGRRPRGRRQRREPVDPLAQEEALLEAARAQLVARPRAALRLISRHERRFAKGQLAQERQVLRARAHVALGQISAARAVAEKFLETYPYSASRKKMEELCKVE